jgi:hypothetical protein
VRRTQEKLEALQRDIEAATNKNRDLTLERRGGVGRGTAYRAADARVVKHHDQQRGLLQKEIELSERNVEHVRKALEEGKETSASLLSAQRELLETKLQLARLSGSKADQRAVLLQQLHVAEDMLREQKKKADAGFLRPGAEIPFEREVLRIKRELYALDGPDLRN